MNIFWNLVNPFWFGDEDFSTNWYQICSKKIGRSLLAHVDIKLKPWWVLRTDAREEGSTSCEQSHCIARACAHAHT